MPKIVQYNLPPGGTVTQLADNQVAALEIEGSDGKDYLIINTVDGSEQMEIGSGSGTSDVCKVSIGANPGTVGEVFRVRQSYTADSLALIENTGAGVALDVSSGTTSSAIDVMTIKNGDGVIAAFNADHRLKLSNPTHENTDGGRESTIVWSGEKADGTAHHLAEIVGSHRGSSDNQNGQLIIKLNSGSSGTSLSGYHYFDGASANVGFNGSFQNGYRLTLNGNDSNPGMLIRNSSASDSDLSGKTRIDFQRRQSGNEYSEAARIESRHDGASDDTLGEFAISTNTGSGLQEQLVINSAGNVGARKFQGIPGIASDVHLLGAGASGDVKINNGDGRDVIIYNGSSTQVAKVDASAALLQLTGPGGTTGMAAPTGAGAPVLFLESSTANSSDRCTLLMNADGGNGCQVDMFVSDDRKLNIQATASEQSIIAEDTLVIKSESDSATRISVGASNFNVQDLATIHAKNSADANGASYEFRKSRHAGDGSHTVVQDNDVIGEIKFSGSDGDSFEGAASIKCRVDGTPADGKMPGDLVFSTSPNTTTGGHTLGDMVERLVIDDLGQPAFKTDTAQLLGLDRWLSGSVTNYGALRTDTNGITMLVTKGGNNSNFSIHANYVQRFNFASDAGFQIYNGHAVPSSSVTDGVILYAEDVSSSSELKVRDEAGNVTTLSPHNFSMTERSDPMAWSHYGKNPFVGKEINVDMLAVVKAVEQLSGQTFIQERDLDPAECRDWDTEEQARVAKSQAAIDEWENEAPEERGEKPRPELYVAQPKPDWMN